MIAFQARGLFACYLQRVRVRLVDESRSKDAQHQSALANRPVHTP